MKTILFLCAVLGVHSALAVTVADKDAVEALVSKTIAEGQEVENTGVGISIFNSKEIILQKGYGYKNREEKSPVTAHTAFAIGSTTKAFTALGLQLLENRNQLKLTDKVTTYLPEFKLSIESIGEQVTIEDMLSHRVGLPRHDLLWLLAKFPRTEVLTRLQYLDFPEKGEENFRKKWVYNNYLFTVAGMIIEERTQMSYENFIQKEILNKLGMSETFMTVPKNYSDMADPYSKETRWEHNDLTNMGPAGSIYSTPSDMTKWIQSWMNKKWQNQDELLRPRISMDPEEPSLNYAYAQAWMTNSFIPEAKWFFHTGSVDGFSTVVLFSPQLDLGIVVLVNQTSSAVGGKLLNALLKYELAKLPKNKNFFLANQFVFKAPNIDNYGHFTKGTKSLLPHLEVKRYEHPGYGVIETYIQGDKTYAQYYSHVWELKPMEHEQYNYFVDMKVIGQEFEFPLYVDERAVYAPFEQEILPIHFSRE